MALNFWEEVRVDSLHPDIGDDVSLRYLDKREVENNFNKASSDPGLFQYMGCRSDDPRVAELDGMGYAFEKSLKRPMYTDETKFFEAGIYKALSLRDLAPNPLYVCDREENAYLALDFLADFGHPSEVEIEDKEQVSREIGRLAGYFEQNGILHGDLYGEGDFTNTLTNGKHFLAIDFTETTFTDDEEDLVAQTNEIRRRHSDDILDQNYEDWFKSGYRQAREDSNLEKQVRSWVSDIRAINHRTNPRT